jgi:prepilin-type processing-associated H-X9-DG protein
MNSGQALPIIQEAFRQNNPLYQYAPNPGVIHCPGDDRYKLPNVGAGWCFDSYSKTQNAGGEGWTPSGPAYWGAGATYTKLSQMKWPADTFVFIEDAGNLGNRGYNVGTWAALWLVSGQIRIIDAVPMYHGNVSTFGYGDGHVTSHKWRNSVLIESGRRAANGINVTSLQGISGAPTSDTDADYAFLCDGYRHPNWDASPSSSR